MKNEEIKIKMAYPPNYKQIYDRFPVIRGLVDVLFPYGDVIYNPHGIVVLDHVSFHEIVHCKQQDGKPEEWWEKYLNDTKFRMNQEVEAYGMQWAFILQNVKDRNSSYPYLSKLSGFLSHSMYDLDITQAQAKDMIVKMAEKKKKEVAKTE